MINLSINQEKIVFAEIGEPILVLASAGSGKTRVLTERIKYILEKNRKEGVITITFTNKAADEMLQRLEDIDDLCWICTIHSLAQRIVEKYGHTIGLPSELHIIEREPDVKAIFIQSLRESDLDSNDFLNITDESEKKTRERIIQNYLNQISEIKRNLLTEDEIKTNFSTDDSFWKIYDEYQTVLLNSGSMDFDDILVYAHKILIEQPWCGDIYRAKYKHICVDEAQDLNKAQYEFIKALCGETIKSLLMVGDPNQMIYGFNGSSSDYLCKNFPEDFNPLTFELKENYRSSKSVISLANKLKPDSQTAINLVLEGINEIHKFQNEEDEASWICDKVIQLLDLKIHPEIEGQISLKSMVVIARNRFVFRELEKHLISKNISFNLKKNERQHEPTSVFGKVLDLGIRVRINPKDWIDGKKLSKVLNIAESISWAQDSLLSKLDSLTISPKFPFDKIYIGLLKSIYLLDIDKPNILKFTDELKETLSQLSEVEKQYEEEIERSIQELLEFRDWWIGFKRKGLGDSLSSFRNAIALGQLTEEYDSLGLTLSTVHTMKGLEKEIVFLMGMTEGVFPDYRAKSRKELEEELNNAFVAITRAKRWIYITYPLQKLMPWGDYKWQTPSRFVQMIQS